VRLSEEKLSEEEQIKEQIKKLKEVALQQASRRKEVMKILADYYGAKAIPAIADIINSSRHSDLTEYGLGLIREILEREERERKAKYKIIG